MSTPLRNTPLRNCHRCGGTGVINPAPFDTLVNCPDCEGTGNSTNVPAFKRAVNARSILLEDSYTAKLFTGVRPEVYAALHNRLAKLRQAYPAYRDDQLLMYALCLDHSSEPLPDAWPEGELV